MNIIGLESLTYGVEDMPTCIRFNQDFGLEMLESGANGAVFQTVEGSTVILRDLRDASLPKAVTPGPQIRRIQWGVTDAAALDAIGAELSKDRAVTRDADGSIWSTDPMGYAIGFGVTRLKAINEAPLLTNVPGAVTRINKRFHFEQRPRVLHLGHVVFHTPNLEQTYGFYRNRLGFKLSDTFVNGVGYFVRSKLTHDHHSLFFLHRGEVAGVNHASYQLRNFDDIAMAGEQMEKKGWRSLTGPGRHHIGSNYFWYFHNPCGGAVEYHADIDYLTDDWEPREWEFRPDVAAAWDRGPGFAAERS